MKILAFISLLLVLHSCGKSKLPDGSYELPFNDVRWRSGESLESDDNQITLRQKMLGDLVENHLIGRERNEVMTMLGEPSTKMDPDGEGSAMSYPTGFERSSYMRIDSEWLLIEFDLSGKSIKYSIGVD